MALFGLGRKKEGNKIPSKPPGDGWSWTGDTWVKKGGYFNLNDGGQYTTVSPDGKTGYVYSKNGLVTSYSTDPQDSSEAPTASVPNNALAAAANTSPLKEHTTPGGEKITRNPDGSVTVYKPDGSWTKYGDRGKVLDTGAPTPYGPGTQTDVKPRDVTTPPAAPGGGIPVRTNPFGGGSGETPPGTEPPAGGGLRGDQVTPRPLGVVGGETSPDIAKAVAPAAASAAAMPPRNQAAASQYFQIKSHPVPHTTDNILKTIEDPKTGVVERIFTDGYASFIKNGEVWDTSHLNQAQVNKAIGSGILSEHLVVQDGQGRGDSGDGDPSALQTPTASASLVAANDTAHFPSLDSHSLFDRGTVNLPATSFGSPSTSERGLVNPLVASSSKSSIASNDTAHFPPPSSKAPVTTDFGSVPVSLSFPTTSQAPAMSSPVPGVSPQPIMGSSVPVVTPSQPTMPSPVPGAAPPVYPPAYTGGAKPVKTEHPSPGVTITTTASGAKIEQVEGHTPYTIRKAPAIPSSVPGVPEPKATALPASTPATRINVAISNNPVVQAHHAAALGDDAPTIPTGSTSAIPPASVTPAASPLPRPSLDDAIMAASNPDQTAPIGSATPLPDDVGNASLNNNVKPLGSAFESSAQKVFDHHAAMDAKDNSVPLTPPTTTAKANKASYDDLEAAAINAAQTAPLATPPASAAPVAAPTIPPQPKVSFDDLEAAAINAAQTAPLATPPKTVVPAAVATSSFGFSNSPERGLASSPAVSPIPTKPIMSSPVPGAPPKPALVSMSSPVPGVPTPGATIFPSKPIMSSPVPGAPPKPKSVVASVAPPKKVVMSSPTPVAPPKKLPVVATAAPKPTPKPPVVAAAPKPTPKPFATTSVPPPKPKPPVAAAAPKPTPKPPVVAAAPKPTPKPPVVVSVAPPKPSIVQFAPNAFNPTPSKSAAFTKPISGGSNAKPASGKKK
ncbi:hypothetical protein HYW35_01460 [Candidatus Saccharibacteria bacterium]|nr:hypothetical protein [Candidatus Saccharibacteria bacterium]